MCVEKQEPYSAGESELYTGTRTNTLTPPLAYSGEQVIVRVPHSATYSAVE